MHLFAWIIRRMYLFIKSKFKIQLWLTYLPYISFCLFQIESKTTSFIGRKNSTIFIKCHFWKKCDKEIRPFSFHTFSQKILIRNSTIFILIFRPFSSGFFDHFHIMQFDHMAFYPQTKPNKPKAQKSWFQLT